MSRSVKNTNISKILEDSLKHSKDDYYFRVKEEKKIESIRVLEILNASLKKDKKLITKEELKKIKDMEKKLQKSIEEDDLFSMKTNLKKLDEISKNFFELQLKNTINHSSVKNILKEKI